MAHFQMTREALDRAPWFLRDEYPYASKLVALPAGTMHHLDEGQGRAVLLVHGTPSWSFEYRDIVARLRARHRCIVPDHIGFGLSDRPTGRGPTLAEHADNLARFVDRLALRELDLVVHDFGGPIGLPLLASHDVRSVTIINSWFWPFEFVDPTFEKKKKWVDNALMRFLYLRANFSARTMVKMSWGRRKPLDRTRHDHYRKMFPTVDSRRATWALAQATISSKLFYDQHADVLRILRSKPVQLVWGQADPFITPLHLEHWRKLLPTARVLELADVGHFPQEEAPAEVAQAIESLVNQA